MGASWAWSLIVGDLLARDPQKPVNRFPSLGRAYDDCNKDKKAHNIGDEMPVMSGTVSFNSNVENQSLQRQC